MLHSDNPAGPAADIVALLDLIERPAVVVARDGEVLGHNQRFAELMETVAADHIETLSSFLLEGSAARILAADLEAAREPFEVVFQDGIPRSLRVDFFRLSSGEVAKLLVLSQGVLSGDSLRDGASLRHDLAGPLTAILGTAELMLIKGQELPREVRNSIGQILENCGRISEILAKSRARDQGSEIL